jgi:oxygen-dependent protoporphyrinogen oxidase
MTTELPSESAVGIVGGGITGLALAHYLDQRGVDFALFEAAPDPGGVIRSERVEGHLLERGPQRIRRTDRVDALIDDLELEGEVRTADPDLPVCVYADGKLRRAPFSVEEFGETDLLSAEAKREVLGEPFTDPADPEESAAELFRRKFGAEAYRNLLGPLFGGIYGSDPAEMLVGHALSGLLKLERRDGSLLKAAIKRAEGGRETPPAISFDDGLQRLPNALADAHGYSVYLETPVETVGESDSEADDGNWTLETPDGTTAVEQVVLTTPADRTADLVADLAPDSAEALRELRYNALAMVYLRADLDAEREGIGEDENGEEEGGEGTDPSDALGYQVGFDEDLRTLGVSWNASMFDREIYTVFLGGMHDPAALAESDEKLGEIAVEEFEQVTGAHADVVDVNRLPRGFPAYDTSWEAIERVDLPEGVRLATNYTARMGVPSRIREAEQLAREI